ncbi:MAG: DNA-binding protein [Candidatus Peregrinibacteria bacterium GW2011_GWF2_33_10]|nr:MAG: DNA-binding protein [Candidatus Peregrinibacteria bacterium GW2011_GWF2_33_10]OGJ45943.1 MAG: cell filamentation protein Fic [Candidatus Peregrinibacteria bacterium RIFOXYA2_FULL_33_21]OGJ46621.1 MAG: cell filamentation protein Fic [Candidatus Peregrinibacteria bacterium RIFOXYA12_FULL_33_12]OGJ51533.1 MAG: cell filamentation protein Fic [Candidatus Peregrinibacteria bacterium RIFOXYB2_FULL_33_20]
MTSESQNQIIIYEGEEGQLKIEVNFENETVWLTQEQMAELFGKGRSTITEHIQNIFKEGELDEKLVCRDSRLTTEHGAIKGKTQEVSVKYYNLDVIISVGYRVKSIQGTKFRQWATARLKEYMIKGFTMDDERLKGTGGGNYWKELLERIRDIRSSEKVLYRQVLDLYATSIDYDSKSKESILFFKTVQNKLHYATNQQTAAELIYSRADAEKEFMGMTNFSGKMPTKTDSTIAKNYLTKDELYRLNRLVSAFFDLAEIKAQDQEPMKMKDWVAELDKFTEMYGKGKLENAGKVSHEKAIEKAEKEYSKYQVKTLSPVEKDYLEVIKVVGKKVAKKVKSKSSKSKK